MNNYYPYNTNYYLQDLKNMRDRIDRTMQEYQHQSQPIAQPPITQNFQLAPTTYNTELEAKYVNGIDDVKNTFVVKQGIFTTKDFSTIWVKDTAGNIRTFSTEEIIEVDEKDKTIASLQKQINELRGVIENATGNSDVDEQTTTKKSTRLSNNTKSVE